MNCENAMELLPWRANGSLSEGERQDLDEHLSRCPACREELEQTRLAAQIYGAHPTADELYDLAGEALAPSKKELIERHVASCSTCAEEVAMIRDSQALLAGEEERERRRAGSVVRGPWGLKSWVPVAMAAAVALAVLGPVWIWMSSRSGSEGSALTASKTLDLPIEIVRGTEPGDEPDAASLPAIRHGDGTVALHLHADGWALEPGVTVELADAAGRVTTVPAASVEQSADAVRVLVDAARLPAGVVVVTVLNADRETRGEARFRVEL